MTSAGDMAFPAVDLQSLDRENELFWTGGEQSAGDFLDQYIQFDAGAARSTLLCASDIRIRGNLSDLVGFLCHLGSCARVFLSLKLSAQCDGTY